MMVFNAVITFIEAIIVNISKLLKYPTIPHIFQKVLTRKYNNAGLLESNASELVLVRL